MSYDLSIHVKTKSDCFVHVLTFERGGVTYNIKEMLEQLKIKYEDSHIPYTLSEWIPLLDNAITELETNITYYEQWNSPNGWGLANHLLPMLKGVKEEIKDSCFPNKALPDLYVSWYSDIEEEKL
jgi:hypothetical protein